MTDVDLERSPLAVIRHRLADALEGGPWEVMRAAVDAVAGPCLIILSGGREPLSISCNYVTRPVVLLVAGRMDPGPGIDILDAQETFVLSRLPWALERVEEEQQTPIAGVAYLTRRVVTRTTVTIRGTE